LKLAVVGAGVSGSYLSALLEDLGVQVEVYEMNPADRGHRCAWGSHYTLLKDKLSKVGLNVDDYIITKVDRTYINGVEVGMGNTVIIDKPKMLRSMLADSQIKASYADAQTLSSRSDLELVVNATGVPHRETPHEKIYTVEERSVLKGAEENTAYILFDVDRVGYGWVFPLSDGGRWFHVGAGCLKSSWDSAMLMLDTLHRYDLYVLDRSCRCEREINIIKGKPKLHDGKVFYVGEATGAVNPITGEGILTSMDTSEALAESITACPDCVYGIAEEYSARISPLITDHIKAYRLLEGVRNHRRFAMLRIMSYMIRRSKNRSKPKLSPKSILRLLLVLSTL
jgi:flavin-dependent dehydrogenase